MGMLKVLSYPFRTWDRPIAFATIALLTAIACFAIDTNFSQLFGGLLLLSGVTIILLSFIILLFKKEFKKAFYTFLFILVLITTFGLFLSA
jgi:hypothetical protein